MSFPVSVRVGALFAYGFALALLQLGRYYVGGIFDYAFVVMLIIPVVSTIHMVLSISAVKYHQHFDTDHPIKGEILTYTLSLANESSIPTVPIKIKYRTVKPGVETTLPDLTVSLKAGERLERDYAISCPYRGVYTVGLEQFELTDLLGWVRVRRPVWHRTFYVYPRVLEVDYPFAIGYAGEINTGTNPGASEDYAQFEGLTQYRHGQSTRHVAWKKFAALGEPYIKSYGRTSEPGVSIYVDLRRHEPLSPAVLEREDCSIEIMVSLVKYFLDRSVPVTVTAMGRSRYTFSADDPGQFPRFHKDTVNLMFSDTISPTELYRGDVQTTALPTSVIFITHMADPDLLGILEDTSAADDERRSLFAAIFNETTMPERDKERSKPYFDSIRNRGGRVVLVEGPDTIAEDLRRIA